VEVTPKRLNFLFSRKERHQHAIRVEDPHLAKIVRRFEICRDTNCFSLSTKMASGDRLVHGCKRVPEGNHRSGFYGEGFSNLGGDVLAVEALCKCEPFKSKRQAKRNVVKAVESVAMKLGNTVTVAGSVTYTRGFSRRMSRVLPFSCAARRPW